MNTNELLDIIEKLPSMTLEGEYSEVEVISKNLLKEKLKEIAPPSGYVLVSIGTLNTWYILASHGNAIPTFEIKALLEAKEISYGQI